MRPGPEVGDRLDLAGKHVAFLVEDRFAQEIAASVDERADERSIFRYRMHTLPTEIGEAIGTSTLFAAWNAAIYVGQIEDERLEPVISSGEYLDATADVLHAHNGIWFNDETFVVSRKRDT